MKNNCLSSILLGLNPLVHTDIQTVGCNTFAPSDVSLWISTTSCAKLLSATGWILSILRWTHSIKRYFELLASGWRLRLCANRHIWFCTSALCLRPLEHTRFKVKFGAKNLSVQHTRIYGFLKFSHQYKHGGCVELWHNESPVTFGI